MLEVYADLEYQRRHLIEQTTVLGRKMVMSGIDRLLDQFLDVPKYLRKEDGYVDYVPGKGDE